MRSPGRRVMTSPRASSSEASPPRSRHTGFEVITSIRYAPSSKPMRKWSRLRNCRHSFVTALRCNSGWCFRPTKSGRSAKETGPMERSSKGTSATLLPDSSRTISAGSLSFCDSGDSAAALNGDCSGLGGNISFPRFIGDDAVLEETPGVFFGLAELDEAHGGRIGDGGMESGKELGQFCLGFCGDGVEAHADDFSGDASGDDITGMSRSSGTFAASLVSLPLAAGDEEAATTAGGSGAMAADSRRAAGAEGDGVSLEDFGARTCNCKK
mmetsp:Transcript_15608/g.45041  ORF Transcript_15608/g.45041 Transcript_15608/m.45041 type:complete len:269 (-) Transcript_15608:454-1260(-)